MNKSWKKKENLILVQIECDLKTLHMQVKILFKNKRIAFRWVKKKGTFY